MLLELLLNRSLQLTYPASIRVECVAPLYSFSSHGTPSALSEAPNLRASSASKSQSPIAMTVGGLLASKSRGARLGDAVHSDAREASGRYFFRYHIMRLGVRNGAYWLRIQGSSDDELVGAEASLPFMESERPAVLSITGRIRSWPMMLIGGLKREAFMDKIAASPPPLSSITVSLEDPEDF